MTQDKNKGINLITYNHLNQPVEVQLSDNNKTVYTYTATGGMLKTDIYESTQLKTTTDYCGAYVYENNTLSYINIPGGRIVNNQSSVNNGKALTESNYQYNLTDQLGNVRVTFTKDTATGNAIIIQEDHYYPFGMRMSGQHFTNTDLINKYLYNNKELQTQTGYYDYGFRQLDPALGRWFVADAMAEKYLSSSPYAYVGNNPINHRDFMGLWSFPVYVNGVLDHYVYGDGGWDTANSTLGGGGGSDLPSCYGGNGGGDGGFGSSGGGGGSSSSGGSLKVNKNISFSDFRYQRGFGGFFMQLKAWWSMKFSWEKETVRVWGSEESTGWDNETDVTQTLPSGLINKIREAFKYKMFYVTSYKEGSNNGTTEETSTYSSQLLKPVDFNTNVKYRGGFWEHNIRYYETKIEIGDNRKKIDAQIWYIPAANQSANIIYYLYPSKTKGLKSFGKDLKQGWRVYYLTNKNNYKILYIGVSASDFILLENYINTGKF